MHGEAVFYQGQKVRREQPDTPEQQDLLALRVLKDRPEFLVQLDNVVQLE